MRVCFDSFCFASTRLSEEDAGQEEQAAVVVEMGSVTELQTILEEKDRKIRELESLVESYRREISELRSHLDKFQSVIPYHLHVSPSQHLTTINNNHQPRARKQRAQGISAEPQSLSTIQELSQKQFPTYPKNDR